MRLDNERESDNVEDRRGGSGVGVGGIAFGNDRLQQQAQGRIVPESFTHGTSAQRVRWFRRGFETGDMNACNTFKAETL